MGTVPSKQANFWEENFWENFFSLQKNQSLQLEPNSKVLFVGNPGTGKSTLLNSIIGKCVFTSGLSIGTGLTNALLQVKIDGIEYMDTPGLSDIKMRELAAVEIKKALTKNGYYYLFFVVTLESGRVRTDDLTTMKLVLDALKNISHLSYGIIVNKVSENMILKLKDMNEFQQLIGFLNAGNPYTTTNIFLYPSDNAACDANNFLMKPNPEFIHYLSSSSGVDISAEFVEQLRINEFEEMKAALEAKTKMLKDENQKLRNKIDEIKKQYEEDMKNMNKRIVKLERFKKKIKEGESTILNTPSKISTSDLVAFTEGFFSENLTINIHACVKEAMKEYWDPSWDQLAEKIERYLRNHSSKWFEEYPLLKRNMIGALTYYTSTASQNPLFLVLNQKLRNSHSLSELSEWQPYITYVYQAYKILPKYKGVTYRNIPLNLLQLDEKYKVGKIVTFSAFTSTTIRQDVATKFLVGHQGTKMVLESVSGICLAPFSLYPLEREVLFPPGCSFLITEIEKNNGISTVFLREQTIKSV